jgi:hypothetical protein
LKQIFKKAGIEVTSENRSEIDKIIHELVAVKYKNCLGTWKEVKKRITEDEDGFVSSLKVAWEKSRKAS